MSTPPKLSVIASKILRTAFGSAISVTQALALGPSSAAAALKASGVRASIATWAPLFTKASQMRLPSPREAPVTTAILPASGNEVGSVKTAPGGYVCCAHGVAENQIGSQGVMDIEGSLAKKWGASAGIACSAIDSGVHPGRRCTARTIRGCVNR